jgi:hypothetical protein
MTLVLDHVSILVTSIDQGLDQFQIPGLSVGIVDTFEDIGTQEVYLGDSSHHGLILLQAPKGPGPYQRAFEKRGPGLHHLGILTEDFPKTNNLLSQLGWFVHPSSLNHLRKNSMVYYVRPGVGTILEIIPKSSITIKPSLVTSVSIPVREGLKGLIEGLGIPQILTTINPRGFLVVNSSQGQSRTLTL